VLLTIIFKIGLQPYLKLTSMAINTLIKYKEAIIIYEESGPIIANYNALITHPKSKPITQPVVTYNIVKQQLTCSNCGKIGHAKETCHNKKRE
jgi:mannitol/fructose-specific phosphotransferase system IIA component (Ntr-type)